MEEWPGTRMTPDWPSAARELVTATTGSGHYSTNTTRSFPKETVSQKVNLLRKTPLYGNKTGNLELPIFANVINV